MSRLDDLVSPTGPELAEWDRRPAADVVLSLRRPATATLLARMRRHRVMPTSSHSWGSEQAYLVLLDGGCPLAVLDVPNGAAAGDLDWRVRLLNELAVVVVLTADPTDSVELLRAGAINVLPRDLPSRELASRLAAERRRLEMSGPAVRRRVTRNVQEARGIQQGTQRVLLHLLSSVSRPLCCHDLCLLLGGEETPLGRRSLQARVKRLNERLADYGMAVRSSAQWGRTTYEGIQVVGR